MQRALAAKSVAHAQTGLMVGGLIKYFMAVIIVVPGIALYGILGDSLGEPDLAFPYLVKTYLPVGVKGVILCGLFASLMSTVDSTFNSSPHYGQQIFMPLTSIKRLVINKKSPLGVRLFYLVWVLL